MLVFSLGWIMVCRRKFILKLILVTIVITFLFTNDLFSFNLLRVPVGHEDTEQRMKRIREIVEEAGGKFLFVLKAHVGSDIVTFDDALRLTDTTMGVPIDELSVENVRKEIERIRGPNRDEYPSDKSILATIDQSIEQIGKHIAAWDSDPNSHRKQISDLVDGINEAIYSIPITVPLRQSLDETFDVPLLRFGTTLHLTAKVGSDFDERYVKLKSAFKQLYDTQLRAQKTLQTQI